MVGKELQFDISRLHRINIKTLISQRGLLILTLAVVQSELTDGCKTLFRRFSGNFDFNEFGPCIR